MANFSVKNQIIDVLGSVGPVISVASTQLCHGSLKAVINSIETNERVCVPIKVYLQNRLQEDENILKMDGGDGHTTI